MLKYKVGDWVMPKINIVDIPTGDPLAFNKRMNEYIGKPLKVLRVYPEEDYTRYQLEGAIDEDDGYIWFWTEDWLDPYDINPIKEIDENSLSALFEV